MRADRPIPGGRPDPAALPRDESLRRHGLALVTSISGALRVGRSYDARNQVFLHQIQILLDTMRPVLDAEGEAVLVAMESDLFLNGVRIPLNQPSFRASQAVAQMLARLRLAGLKFEQGLAGRDLAMAFDLILKTDGPTGADLLVSWNARGILGVAPIVAAATVSSQARCAAPASEPSSGATGTTRPAEGEPAPGGDGPRTPGADPAASRQRHLESLQGARLLLMPTSLQGNIEIRHAKRVVQPLVEGVSMADPVLIGLTSLAQHDEQTYAHAVNVGSVSVAIGHFLGLSRRTLADLGVAALLHDVGKQAVAGRLTHDLEEFTAEERAAAERHPIEGVKLLARSTTLNPTTFACLRVALEHHAAVAGSGAGYPALPAGWRPGLLSQIVAVADCFMSLQARLSLVTPAVSPSDALGIMLGPLARRFEPALLWALVRSVGFYPAGQIVELDDGSLAVSLTPNVNDPARPHVRVFLLPDGTLLEPSRRPELRPIPPERSVRRALRIEEYPAGAATLLAGPDPSESIPKAA